MPVKTKPQAEQEWTIARVIEEMPDVPVYARKSKKRYTGHITGRRLDFPKVWFDGLDGIVETEVAWATLVHILNDGTELLF